MAKDCTEKEMKVEKRMGLSETNAPEKSEKEIGWSPGSSQMFSHSPFLLSYSYFQQICQHLVVDESA